MSEATLKMSGEEHNAFEDLTGKNVPPSGLRVIIMATFKKYMKLYGKLEQEGKGQWKKASVKRATKDNPNPSMNIWLLESEGF